MDGGKKEKKKKKNHKISFHSSQSPSSGADDDTEQCCSCSTATNSKIVESSTCHHRQERHSSGTIVQPMLENCDSDSDDSSLTLTSPTHDAATIKYDQLTVFQAAPLVWRDNTTGQLHPIEMLDFDREREILADALGEAKHHGRIVNVHYEVATVDRLAAFLATGENNGRALHFSCHGIPQHLCLEDGSGGVQLLQANDLRELLSVGSHCEDQLLRFVFISACYSRAAGEAFVKAGVPHVLCCRQDDPLMDVASIEFARNFYRAIACGKNLKVAFDLGRQAVKLSPLVPDSEIEMGKFVLLPEGVEHDVPIFYLNSGEKHQPPRARCASAPTWILPYPPKNLVGREMDMYKVLQALRSMSRLIRLTGPSGIGKASLAAAVCRYVEVRRRAFSIQEVIWLPLMHTSREDDLSCAYRVMFDVICDESIGTDLHVDGDYRRTCGTIIEYLHHKKALIVIDTKRLLEATRARKLTLFLQDLFSGTKDVKVILLGGDRSLFTMEKSCIESEINLHLLGFQCTAILFGMICPYISEERNPKVSTPRQLANLLVPDGKEKSKFNENTLSKRSLDIFRLIGEGLPSKLYTAAKDMSPEQYDELIEIAERKEQRVDYKSRLELERHLKKMRKGLRRAVRMKNYVKAKEIQEDIDDLEGLRESLPDQKQLRSVADTTAKELKNAVASKDFGRAERLHGKLVHIEGRIEQEKQASSLISDSESCSSSVSSKDDSLKTSASRFATRIELEFEIRRLQDVLKDAVDQLDFTRAGIIHASIIQLEKNREHFPSSAELLSKITNVNEKLRAAIDSKDFLSAESFHRERQLLEQQLAIEKESDAKIFDSVGDAVATELATMSDCHKSTGDNSGHARRAEPVTSALAACMYRRYRVVRWMAGTKVSHLMASPLSSSFLKAREKGEVKRRRRTRQGQICIVIVIGVLAIGWIMAGNILNASSRDQVHRAQYLRTTPTSRNKGEESLVRSSHLEHSPVAMPTPAPSRDLTTIEEQMRPEEVIASQVPVFSEVDAENKGNEGSYKETDLTAVYVDSTVMLSKVEGPTLVSEQIDSDDKDENKPRAVPLPVPEVSPVRNPSALPTLSPIRSPTELMTDVPAQLGGSSIPFEEANESEHDRKFGTIFAVFRNYLIMGISIILVGVWVCLSFSDDNEAVARAQHSQISSGVSPPQLRKQKNVGLPAPVSTSCREIQTEKTGSQLESNNSTVITTAVPLIDSMILNGESGMASLEQRKLNEN